jgi:hypothetical protein
MWIEKKYVKNATLAFKVGKYYNKEDKVLNYIVRVLRKMS